MDKTDITICPECGEKSIVVCRCLRSESVCKNGHTWHWCVRHGIVAKGKVSHGIPTDQCTCGNGLPDEQY